MILFLPPQICIFHYGAILWRSLSDFEYLSLPVTTKSLSPACGSTDCQLAKRFNYSRCLIFTRDLSSAREQNKTFFFQPHKCFYATFWHKEHEITWLPEFHVRPLICFEYKSLTPQTRAITKEVQRPYCTLFCIQDSGRKVVQSVLENNDALHPIFGPFCVVHTQKLITATFQVV